MSLTDAVYDPGSKLSNSAKVIQRVPKKANTETWDSLTPHTGSVCWSELLLASETQLNWQEFSGLADTMLEP